MRAREGADPAEVVAVMVAGGADRTTVAARMHVHVHEERAAVQITVLSLHTRKRAVALLSLAVVRVTWQQHTRLETPQESSNTRMNTECQNARARRRPGQQGAP